MISFFLMVRIQLFIFKKKSSLVDTITNSASLEYTISYREEGGVAPVSNNFTIQHSQPDEVRSVAYRSFAGRPQGLNKSPFSGGETSDNSTHFAMRLRENVAV